MELVNRLSKVSNLKLAVMALVMALGLWSARPCLAWPPADQYSACQGPESCPRNLLTACPDDYSHKAIPSIRRLPCGEEYCYCPKPWPHIWRLPCGGVDDYCRKPCPKISRPICPDHYRCVGNDQPCP